MVRRGCEQQHPRPSTAQFSYLGIRSCAGISRGSVIPRLSMLGSCQVTSLAYTTTAGQVEWQISSLMLSHLFLFSPSSAKQWKLFVYLRLTIPPATQVVLNGIQRSSKLAIQLFQTSVILLGMGVSSSITYVLGEPNSRL